MDIIETNGKYHIVYYSSKKYGTESWAVTRDDMGIHKIQKYFCYSYNEAKKLLKELIKE